MSNEIANPFGGAVAISNADAMAAALTGSAAEGRQGGAPDGSDFLNFSGKRGAYEFGPDKSDVENNEVWLVNIAAFEDGWVCWKGGTPAATRLSNIYNGQPIPEPDPQELGPFSGDGDGWHKAKSMVLKSVDEDDRQGYFKINSKSGVSAFADLQTLVADRFRSGQPAWPLVQLDKESFTAKGHKHFKPKLVVYGWLDDARVAELAADPDADLDDLIKAAKAGGADEEEAPKPRRGRRDL